MNCFYHYKQGDFMNTITIKMISKKSDRPNSEEIINKNVQEVKEIIELTKHNYTKNINIDLFSGVQDFKDIQFEIENYSGYSNSEIAEIQEFINRINSN